MLNPASVAGLFSAVVCLFALACVYPLGRVPDWEDLRPVTWVALTAAGVSASNLPASLELTPAVHIWTSRLEVMFLALHVLAWMVYLPGWANRPVRSLPPALWPLPALALAALVPGVVFGADAPLVPRPVAWLGVTYWDPGVRPTAYVIWAGLAVYAAWGVVRVVRWGRTGAPYPRSHLACIVALCAMAVHDAAVVGGLLRISTPYLLDFGFYLPVTFFGVMTLNRISDHATDYHRLRAGLETAVVDRSRMLEESRAALLRVERVALGRLSVGVAQEVKAPATAAAASLELLSRDLAGVPDEVLHKLDEARAGVGHVLGLARQLWLAGRRPGSGAPSLEPVRLAWALEPALASARARAEHHALLRVSVADDLWVRASQEALSEALAHLVVNAVLAIPVVRAGTVSVEAQRLGGRVRVVVEDDGVGMSEEELRHVFDPFHGSKPPGMGSGLGLAVARNLIESMQGTLRFESAVGRGSRAFVELARSTPTTQGAVAVEAPDPAAAARANLLVIDDDAQVLKSMARLLGRQHVVRTASSVQEGLAAVAEQTFDLILCDVMMPRGGGERFWAELLLNAPRLMDRVAFMTGGAPSHESRDFLRRTPRPVLVKPFDGMAVNELLAQLAGPGAAPEPERETSSGSFTLGRMGRK
jgi:signal transduction histidine kinase/ActR/RegA family two-component response regulator